MHGSLILLITNKTYTPEANELAKKIYLSTRERHAKWMVSIKYILDQNDVDGVFSRQSEFCESIILKENERISHNQRLLLECEGSRVQERRKAFEDKQNTHMAVIRDIASLVESMMIKETEKLEINKLFTLFPDFSYFLNTAYSPSLSFGKLEVLTTNDSQLRRNLIDLVNDPKFCKRLGKSDFAVQDGRMAVGRLGVDNSRLLFPILMAKPLLKWGDPVTKNIAPKAWQHLILTANTTRMRLKQNDIKNSDQGIILGVLRSIGLFSIVNRFSQVFEDSLVAKMQEYREQDRRNEYYACADVKPELSILPQLILRLEKSITRKVVDSIEWSPTNIHLKNALLEDLDDVPVVERGEYGAALAQAQVFSMYDALERSKVFVEKQKLFLFSYVQMPADSLNVLCNLSLGRISLNT